MGEANTEVVATDQVIWIQYGYLKLTEEGRIPKRQQNGGQGEEAKRKHKNK